MITNDKANYALTKGSLERLNGRKWFNDEIINSYIALINERSKRLNLCNVFVFNTFFYTMVETML